ncbi:tetratricopeptide repeat protein [Micromonospora avicenniae]|uniref:Tetratricopeptide repeat-containing protein n=1 Tax=Micromonospora avicenniae TaxID=1198245 RepID=A0A1N6QZL3_9ACTN|nr:tetratricopeptide repeat protein [Micromonospora avicenniae]SIQ21766.1 Tetratricopeptide repeat-containing protein [Micromonospora avicenniae]
MSSDAAPDQSTTDGYLQRAKLLAELGRYDEAAAEVSYAVALEPANAVALTLLARLHLAAGRPAEALTVADTALAAAPGTVAPLVARGMALADLERYAESARAADEILAIGPDDAYAQRSAAAILAGSRNGQPALNAAWRAVELTPEEPEGHLVLGLVAANLHLYDLAERAYREALRLDPRLAEARHDIGVIRLEQRRWSEALEHLAEAAATGPARVDGGRSIPDRLRRMVLYAAGWSLVVAVLVAFLAAPVPGASRVVAVATALGGVLVAWRYAARMPGLVGATLPWRFRADRSLTLALYAVAAAPVLLVLYALVGGPWPLVASIIAATAAESLVLIRR